MKYVALLIVIFTGFACSKNSVNPSSTDQTATPGTYGNYFFYDSLVSNGKGIAFLSTVDSGIAYPGFDSCTVWASGKFDSLSYSIKTTYKTVPAYKIVCQMTLNNKTYKYNALTAFSMGGAQYEDTIKAVYVSGLNPNGNLSAISFGTYTLYQAFNIPVRFVK